MMSTPSGLKISGKSEIGLQSPIGSGTGSADCVGADGGETVGGLEGLMLGFWWCFFNFGLKKFSLISLVSA